MKKTWMLVVAALTFTSTVQADLLGQCRRDAASITCTHYLEGLIDGALMYKSASFGKRVDTSGYEGRALKYRGGKRYEEANRVYCAERIADKQGLIAGVAEAVESGDVTDLITLEAAVRNMLDCNRQN